MTTLLPIALSLLLQSAVLISLGLLALRLTGRFGPNIQSLIGRSTLVGVALLLVLSVPLSRDVPALWHLSVASEPTVQQTKKEPPSPPNVGALLAVPSEDLAPSVNLAPNGKEKEGAAGSAPTSHQVISSSSRPVTEVRGNNLADFAALWAFGTLSLLGWLGLCQCHLIQLRRTACPLQSGPAFETLAALTPRPPKLFIHPVVQSPFLAGLVHPTIFLPPNYKAEFGPTALRAILAHELAHRDRRDNRWALASHFLCAMLWPQPLLWLLCRRLEQINEEACDQAVLAQNCPPRAYADCLLTLAERRPLGRRERVIGAGVAPFRSSLGRRISRILDKGTYTMSAISLPLRLTIIAGAAAAVFAGTFLISSAPAQSPGKDQASLGTTQRLKEEQTQDAANLKAISFALRQYVQDNDEYYPRAAHWMDALSPYLKDKTVFFDPFQPGAKRYGYALNRRCSGKSLAAFVHPSETIAIFGSTSGVRNASDTGQSLRAAVIGTVLGSHYLFVDGAVKWLRPTNGPSFTVQWDQRWRYKAPPGYLPSRNGPQLHSSREKRGSLNRADFLAGLTPVEGPGVVVTLRDSKKPLPQQVPAGMLGPNLIHDTDINQVVNELKSAGAEAIAVNNQRLVTTSAFRCVGPTVFVNNLPKMPPFAIVAIGNPKAMIAALNFRGGLATQLRNFDSAMISIREAQTLLLPAYSEGSGPRYAKPVSAINPVLQQNIDIEVIRALTQKHDQLAEQLRSLDMEAASLTAQYQQALTQRNQALKKMPPVFSAEDISQIRLKRQTSARQIEAAQADLTAKKATMAPGDPAVFRARLKLQSLEKAYRQPPVLEKQFVSKVHQYTQQQVTIFNTFAYQEKSVIQQFRIVQQQRHQLKSIIASLNKKITEHLNLYQS